MGNSYFLQSAQDGLVFDITAPTAARAPLQVSTKNNGTNQLWTIESSAQEGFFHILSAGQNNLAVDIKAPAASRARLQVFTKNNGANQLWKFAWFMSDFSHAYFSILSANQGLAIDIKTPVASGSPLQAFEPKSEDLNQLWTFVPAPTNTPLQPHLRPPTTFIPLDPEDPPNSFNVSGTGFFPIHYLTLSWLYTISGGSGLSTSDSVAVLTDPTGAFSSFNQLPDLVDTGTLEISVTDPATGEAKTETAYWNGIAWAVV